MEPENLQQFAERVRAACLEVLIEAYDDAGLQGICAEGRWEAAVGALRRLDLTRIVDEVQTSSKNSSGR
ncbi:MAG TPA: acetyltransferase [Candidatus Binatia bacterium]